MADTLKFPKSRKMGHLHFVGTAILAVGIGMLVAGQFFSAGPLKALFPLFGGLDLILGVALITYRREVSINPATRIVTYRRWILMPVHENTYIPGAFDHVEIKGTVKGGYSVSLCGNRTLFLDGPTDLEQARVWAQELKTGTGWGVLERREVNP